MFRPTSRRSISAAYAAAVAAAAFAAYALTLGAPAFYDDEVFIQGNRVFSLPLGPFLAGVFSRDYFLFTGERTYQPLITLFHYLTHPHPAACRFAGIALHALNGALLFLLARRLLRDDRKAFLAGLLFALFPPNTEAIAIASFKGHPAALSCILASLLAWTGSSLPAAFAFFAAGLLCKETALILPILIVAWPHPSREKLRAVAAFLSVALLYLGLRFLVLTPPPALEGLVGPGRATILSFGWYLGKLFWPHPLCLERSLPAGGGWLYAALVVGFVAAFAALRRASAAFFAMLWILAGTLPFLHLIPFANYSPVADRYLYLPAAGFCILLAGSRVRRPWLFALVLAWGILSVRRSAAYLDREILIRQTAACAPDNPRAQAMLGGFYMDRARDYRKSLECFERAFSLDPGFRTRLDDPGLTHIEGSPYILGRLKLELGDAASAEKLLDEGVRKGPDAALTLMRGNARAALGKEPAALRDFDEAASLAPSWFLPPLKSGLLRLRRGDKKGALERLERAQALDPGDIRLPETLAQAFQALGRPAEAGRLWRAAAEREPARAELWAKLAENLRRQGEEASSRAAYGRAAQAAEDALERLRRPEAAGQAQLLRDMEAFLSDMRKKAGKQ